MSKAAKKACGWPGCPGLVSRGTRYCAAHAHKEQPKVSEDRRKRNRFYASAKWRRLREQQLYDEPWCQDCDKEFATDVDHIVPIGDGGDPYAPDNLQSLCHSCHSRKTAREGRWGKGGAVSR